MKKILGFLLACSFLINLSVFADTPEEDGYQQKLEQLQLQLEKKQQELDQFVTEFQAQYSNIDSTRIQLSQTLIKAKREEINGLEQTIAKVQKQVNRQAKKNGQTTTSYNTPTKLLDAVA